MKRENFFWTGLLVISAFISTAQVAVKFYSSEPSTNQNRLLGIPTNVISQVIFTNGVPGTGWTMLTEEEYRNIQQLVRPLLRAWATNIYEPWALTNSQPSSLQVSNRTANIQALKDLSDTMQTAEESWGTLTPAQIQGLVRVHNQVLLRLRPLLRDLYQERLE